MFAYFRQEEQYQMKRSLDLVGAQGTKAISPEQEEQVILDFRIPRCWRKFFEASAVDVML